MLKIVCTKCHSDDVEVYQPAGLIYNGFHCKKCGALFGDPYMANPMLFLKCLKEVK